MLDLLRHPWVRVLLFCATVGTVCWALRETATITVPLFGALAEVALPLAIGFTIAYVLTPLVDRSERNGMNRVLAAFVLFALFGIAMVVAISLVLPAVIRQSTALATRVFQGETYIDTNHNHRYDKGEPFDDLNGNGRYDPDGLLAEGIAWSQRHIERMRRMLNLGLDQQALGFLVLYQEETGALRGQLDQAINLARDGIPFDQWPAELRQEPPADAPTTWSSDWPGSAATDLAAAAARLPREVQERWQRGVDWIGARFAAKHQRLLSALRQARGAGRADDPADGELVARLRALWQRSLTPAESDIAHKLAALLVEEDKRGQPAAGEILIEIGGAGSDTGNRTLGTVMANVETQVQAELDAAPARFGSWVKSALQNLDWVLSVSLSVLLVPIYAFFLTLAMPSIRQTVGRYLPARGRERTVRILHHIESVVSAFFRGRLIVCLICAVLTWIGFLILGVPYAVLFGLFIGLATVIPFAGLIFLLPAVGLTLADGGSGLAAIFVVVVYAVVQTLETVVLTPTIMGREVELHPVVLILALLLCGKLLGILGLILAVPIAATIRILAREFVLPRLRTLAALPPKTAAYRRTEVPAPAPAAAAPPLAEGKTGERDLPSV